MKDLFDISGRCALVTGAGTGIGQHAAIVLARAGAKVAMTARRRDKLEETAASISAAGGEAFVTTADVTDQASVASAFDATIEAFGIPEIVINNAGLARVDFLTRLSESDWDTVIDTNLKGVHQVGAEAARRLIEAKHAGTIVNMASALAMGVEKGQGAYMASKAGVVQLTKALALECARYNIRVNAIAPGYISTDMNRDVLASDFGQQMLQRIPQRRFGDLKDLTGPLLLLASDASAFMTGSVLSVDGGHLLQSL